MPNNEMLKKRIGESGMTIVAICSKAGIERATLYNRLNNRGEWTASEIVGMSNALHLSTQEREEIFLV